MLGRVRPLERRFAVVHGRKNAIINGEADSKLARPTIGSEHALRNGRGHDQRQKLDQRLGSVAYSFSHHERLARNERTHLLGRNAAKREAHISLAEPETRTWRAVRQTRSKAMSKTPRLWRHISTTASIEDLEGLFEADDAVTESYAQPPQVLPEVRQMLDKISEALKQGASDWLFKILSPALLESKTMAAIADDTFTAMLAMWCAKDYFEGIIDHHLAVSEKDARNMRMSPLQTIIEEYLSVVTNVAYMRRKAGCRLTTGQYKHLLAAAHNTGSTTVSKFYWNWMTEDEAAPDVDCFAHYLGAHVWNDMLPAYRERSHLTPFNVVAREHPYAGKPFDNYKVRLGGIKQTVTEILTEMTKARVAPNEALLCNVLTGFAREGDTRGMSKVLQRTWGISVSSIMADSDSPPAVRLPIESPLQPTDKLLKTIAFAYGINSSLPMALRLIDYISRHFSVSPSRETWDMLLTWAYVLSRPRKTTSEFKPPLDQSAVLRVWDTMLAPPYNIVPSLAMYDKLVRGLVRQQKADDVLAVMQAGFEARIADVQALTMAEMRLTRALETGSKGDVERAQREVEDKVIQSQRGARYLKTWSRMLLGLTRDIARRPEPGQKAEDVLYRAVPGLLAGKWCAFVGRRMQYTLPTGLVEIDVVVEDQVDGLHARLATQSRARKGLMDRSVRAVGHEWIIRRFESRRLTPAQD